MVAVALADFLYGALRDAIAWFMAAAGLIGGSAAIIAFLMARGRTGIRIICVLLLMTAFQFGVIATHILTNPQPPPKERMKQTFRSPPTEEEEAIETPEEKAFKVTSGRH